MVAISRQQLVKKKVGLIWQVGGLLVRVGLLWSWSCSSELSGTGSEFRTEGCFAKFVI